MSETGVFVSGQDVRGLPVKCITYYPEAYCQGNDYIKCFGRCQTCAVYVKSTTTMTHIPSWRDTYYYPLCATSIPISMTTSHLRGTCMRQTDRALLDACLGLLYDISEDELLDFCESVQFIVSEVCFSEEENENDKSSSVHDTNCCP